MAPMDLLTPGEWQQSRSAFTTVMGDKAWIETGYELQRVCTTMGLNPSMEDVEAHVAKHTRIDFMSLLNYIGMLKREHFAPEPRDVNTKRAFQAVGGVTGFNESEAGQTIGKQELFDVCKAFNVEIDSNQLSGEEGGGTLNYAQFAQLFADEAEPVQPRLKLGHDYAALVERAPPNPQLTHPGHSGHHPKRSRSRTKSQLSVMASQRRLSVATPKEPEQHQQRDSGGGGGSGEDADGQVQRLKRKSKKKRKKGHVLDASTRPCGRTGVYVDDTMHEGFLPNLPRGSVKHQAHKEMPVSPVLARIDARVDTMRKAHPVYVRG